MSARHERRLARATKAIGTRVALTKKAASAAFLLDDGWLLGQAKACEVIPDFSTSTNASIFAERIPVRHAITVQTFR
jgi:hypothetical protein